MRQDKFFQFNETVSSVEAGIALMETKLRTLNEQAQGSNVPYAQSFETRLLGECLKGSIDRCHELIKEGKPEIVVRVLFRFAISLQEQNDA